MSILMGWDRPTQGYFMVVENLQPKNDDEDEYLYSNLSDPALMPLFGVSPDLAYFLAKLDELHLQVPIRMLDEIRNDARRNAGSRCVSYDQAGTPTETFPG